MDALNILYVACTRAKYELHIWPVKPSESKIKRNSITNISDLIYFFLYKSDFFIPYKESIVNVAKNKIKTICYNFMPVIDWTRTQLDYKLPTDGLALRFNYIHIRDNNY